MGEKNADNYLTTELSDFEELSRIQCILSFVLYNHILQWYSNALLITYLCTILPTGVVSKNAIGPRRIFFNIPSWRTFAACKTPRPIKISCVRFATPGISNESLLWYEKKNGFMFSIFRSEFTFFYMSAKLSFCDM